MARLPRLDLPGVPQHIIQRGNNRGPCFFARKDYRVYLTFLREVAAFADCAIHAYVLMTNHVHLLLTGNRPGAVSVLMQALGRRYVYYFNTSYQRSGTLFEGRFRSSLIQTERYLMCCYRYIELNPVRAQMVTDPADYDWSSYRHHALGERNRMIAMHSELVALGRTAEERCARYRSWTAEVIPDAETVAIRLHANKNCAWGDRSFQEQVEALARRRAKVVGRGRPRRTLPEINEPDPFIDPFIGVLGGG